MKIVFASDTFKGTLTATEIGEIGEEVVKKVFGRCNVEKIPMADGGEGTVDCLIEAMCGERVTCTVQDPLGREIQAEYGRFGECAIIEMSSASGITLVEESERNIFKQTTYGTGQLILHALENGANHIYIGIGGSATNDGGLGFAEAIGVIFLDKENNRLDATPENFEKIDEINTGMINPLIQTAEITVMCDVTNPLLGLEGATYVFGKQKGATEQTIPILEKGMEHYINLAEAVTNKQVRYDKGAGAAGGLGAALKLFTNAKMCSGIDTVLNILDFNNKIYDADLVITGEGRMDYQSAYGKVASGVAKVCKEQNIPCVAVVGGMGERANEMLELGIRAIVPIVDTPMPLSQALKNARPLYKDALERTLSLIKIGMEYLPK